VSCNSTLLNGICPYFTMFRLDFPLRVLKTRASITDVVLDPFSGRGTTNYAARLLGLDSVGIDSNPVAAALTQAKLANADSKAVVAEFREILEQDDTDIDVPSGEFWEWAFHKEVLRRLCQLRCALLKDCESDTRKALRAVIMGALHGPVNKGDASYFSNQCTRTYSPKPAYAVRYWRTHDLEPRLVDMSRIISVRASRYYDGQPPATGLGILGDSRNSVTYEGIRARRVKWIITSPPFYGLRTYVPDQWLRNWFVGGSNEVDYSCSNQLEHSSAERFAAQLRVVWTNVASVSSPDAWLVVRFGGISDRAANPIEILKTSFSGSPWKLNTIKPAGSADIGKRQAQHFGRVRYAARPEYDAWARIQ
jgi:DNA methylase